jgi:hypothetical protein
MFRNGEFHLGKISVPTAVLLFLSALIVIFFGLFIITYPLNIWGYGDGPNYLRMILLRESNLMHASGGPFIIGSLLKLLGTTMPAGAQYTPDFLFKILLAQYAVHSTILFVSVFICVRTFGFFAGAILLLVWATSVSSLAFVSSTLPDGLVGDLICLMTMFCLAGYLSDRASLKAAAYLSASFLLAWAFLVKYNAAPFGAMLLAFILIESATWRWRLIVLGGCGAIFAAIVVLYVQLFHLPTTGTTDLNYDHAWILLNPVADGKNLDFNPAANGMDPNGLNPSNGINTQRWIALSAIVPPSYEMAGAYRTITDISTPEIRSKYRAQYQQIMQLSESELREFIDRHPLPPTFNVHPSAVPLYYYIGLRETDQLGIKVFLEFVAANPVTYAKKVLLNTFMHPPASTSFAMVPFPHRMFDLKNEKVFGNSFVELTGTLTEKSIYSSPNAIVWWPGARFFEWLDNHLRPSVIEKIALAVGLAAIFCSPSSRGRRLSALLLAMWVVYATFCHFVFYMRFKEAVLIWPFTSLILAIGLRHLALALSALKRRKHPDASEKIVDGLRAD